MKKHLWYLAYLLIIALIFNNIYQRIKYANLERRCTATQGENQ